MNQVSSDSLINLFLLVASGVFLVFAFLHVLAAAGHAQRSDNPLGGSYFRHMMRRSLTSALMNAILCAAAFLYWLHR